MMALTGRVTMFKKIGEWIKGNVHTTETLIDVVTFEGKIPPYLRYPEEPFRFQVWVYRDTVTRDAYWVRPKTSIRYVVKPMTKHLLPTDRRARTINVYETSEAQTFKAKSAKDAVTEYLAWLRTERYLFEKAYEERVV
jgi:hypothetical protein